MYPSELRYHKEHAWARTEDDVVIVGISHFAQDQLGEVVYVDLPAEGDTVIIDETFGEIESVKSVSELHAPLSGEIIEVNTALEDSPETVNEDAYGGGWMIKVQPTDLSELDTLMSSDDYETFLEKA